MAYKNCVSSDVVYYRHSVVPQLRYVRDYVKNNLYDVIVSECVDLGDGDYFIDYLRCHENKRTGNVAVTNSVSSHSSGPISPAKNCGKIDLDNVSDDVVSRYAAYFKARNTKCSLKLPQ